MKRTVIIAISLLLCILLFAGCGEEDPESIRIMRNRADTTVIEMQTGQELTDLYAVLSPADHKGKLSWTSDAPDIVKVGSTDGAECTLNAVSEGSAVVTVKCGGVSTFVRVNVHDVDPHAAEADAALTIRGVEYSRDYVTICFAEQYYSFANYYGEYAAYYGLDTSAGLESLSTQPFEYSSDGTWYGYFRDLAVEYLQQVQALCDYARANGIALTEEDLAGIDGQMEQIGYLAELYGFDSAADYLAEYYGSSIPVEDYREYMENSVLADKANKAFLSSLTYTEEELAAHYLEMGFAEGENDYPVTAMRHLLIMAEPDENGEYTGEAIAAAHAEAVRLYEEWSAGEKTEDSFAALAAAYSDDTGSVGNGGLYEGIYNGQMVPGINAWLFDESRAVGDTAVIDNNGSYVGTHIVYFVGWGKRYCDVLAFDDLQSRDAEKWFTELAANYIAQPGRDYMNIGK